MSSQMRSLDDVGMAVAAAPCELKDGEHQDCGRSYVLNLMSGIRPVAAEASAQQMPVQDEEQEEAMKHEALQWIPLGPAHNGI